MWRLRDEDALVDDERDDEGGGFDKILGFSCLADCLVVVDDRCESECCARGWTRASMSDDGGGRERRKQGRRRRRQRRGRIANSVFSVDKWQIKLSVTLFK